MLKYFNLLRIIVIFIFIFENFIINTFNKSLLKILIIFLINLFIKLLTLIC
jgi:hypothetical protein